MISQSQSLHCYSFNKVWWPHYSYNQVHLVSLTTAHAHMVSYSDMVHGVEGAMSCGYLPSVARHCRFMLEESSKQPLSGCIGWTHYSDNQVRPSLQPTQFGQ